MSYTSGYVEHVALQVRDMDWYLHYFGEVFGMELTRKEEREGKLRQVWLNGGIQLTASPDFEIARQEDQGVTHLGLLVENPEIAIEESYTRGLRPVEGKKNWIWLPDGVALEIKRSSGASVADVLAVRSQ